MARNDWTFIYGDMGITIWLLYYQVSWPNLPRGVLDPLTCAPQSFGPLNMCHAEFLRQSFWAKKKHKKYLKITFSFFFKGIFVSLSHFRYL